MVTLEKITAQNFDAVLALRVKEGQEEFVASNAESIAQTTVQPDCYPYAIYAEGVPVGFIMYCLDEEDGEYWLYRLMVDAARQGKGYGSAVLRLIIEKIESRNPGQKNIFGCASGIKGGGARV